MKNTNGSVSERVCQKCGQYHLKNPQRRPELYRQVGTSVVFGYSTGLFRRGFLFRLGAWRPKDNTFELAQLLTEEELTNLRSTIDETLKEVALAKKTQRN